MTKMTRTEKNKRRKSGSRPLDLPSGQSHAV